MYHPLCMSIVVPLAFVGTSAIAMLAKGSLQGGPTASVPKYNFLIDSTPLRSTLPPGAHSICEPCSRSLDPIFSGVFYFRAPHFLISAQFCPASELVLHVSPLSSLKLSQLLQCTGTMPSGQHVNRYLLTPDRWGCVNFKVCN
jgi:hypothetical protein